MSEEVSWSSRSTQVKSEGPHRDYNVNLNSAKIFCKTIRKSLIPGMKVELGSSHGLQDSLLKISFIPPKNSKLGNYSTPISLHQNQSTVNGQIEKVINTYMDFAKKFIEKQQLPLI